MVAIGRNEGDRLKACLESLVPHGLPMVYVDSGSCDGSVELARRMGCSVVQLDRSLPFSAARARNEGANRLHLLASGTKYIQFLDGDCVLRPRWLQQAEAFLDANHNYAVVCGRLRERFPHSSIYNRLCDLEWDTPIGDALACGGVAMMRVSAFEAVGGFDPTVVAAEDDELCLRLRQSGFSIARLDADMALHDAAMTRFSQWWKRAKRSGHAYAQGAALHGRSPQRHFIRQCQSTWFWGLLVPVLVFVLAWWCWGLSILLLAGYPILALRIYRYGRRREWSCSDSRLYALFTVLAKWPQLTGMLQYHWNQWRGKRPVLIEYKRVQDSE